MANESPTLYVRKYNDNLQLLTQQMDVRFRNAMDTDTHFGKTASPVDQVGETTIQTRTARFQPKVNTDIPHDRRWVNPTSFTSTSLVDKFDDIRMRVQLNSRYMQSQNAAMSRKMDDTIIDAFFGTALTGEEGGTSTTFPAGQQIGTTAGDMTVAKVLEGRQLLLENDVDIISEDLFLGISPHQENTLINSTEINNADLVQNKTIFDKDRGLHGKTWFGITFIVSNRIQNDAGVREAAGTATDRACPMWVRSGMHLGLWDDIRGTINLRVDLVDDPWDMSIYSTHGATRIEEVKVVRILCDET